MRRWMPLGLLVAAVALTACSVDTSGSSDSPSGPGSAGGGSSAAGDAAPGELVGGIDPDRRQAALAAAEDFDLSQHTSGAFRPDTRVARP